MKKETGNPNLVCRFTIPDSGFLVKIEFYHSSFFQRLLHVDDALVAAAPEEEGTSPEIK